MRMRSAHVTGTSFGLLTGMGTEIQFCCFILQEKQDARKWPVYVLYLVLPMNENGRLDAILVSLILRQNL